MKEVKSELQRMLEQLEKHDSLTFDSVIAIYTVLDKVDPERVYDPKNPENMNEEREVA